MDDAKTIDYEEYVKKAREMLAIIEVLFRDKISDELGKVEHQMVMCESYYGNIRYLISWADYWISVHKDDIMKTIGKDVKQDERRAIINREQAVENRIRSQLHAKQRAMEERLCVCRCILRFAESTGGHA